MADCFDFRQAPLAPPVWSGGGAGPIPSRGPKPPGPNLKPRGRIARQPGKTRGPASAKRKRKKSGKKP